MSYKDLVKGELTQAQSVLTDFIKNKDNLAKVEQAAEMISDCILSDGKVISCGNGGSHCDAMHFAEELTGRFRDNRRSLAAIAISDPSFITCAGNDFGFDFIFSRFVEGTGLEDDILLGISTSGNSKNVINAVRAAKNKGMRSIVLTGNDGGKLGRLADLEIRVPHKGYADRIQEVHIKIIHTIILLVEKMVAEED